LQLDIVVWSYPEEKSMIAVPLTGKGCRALMKYMVQVGYVNPVEKDVFLGVCPLEVGPEEFTRSIDKEVSVFLYQEESSLLFDIRSMAVSRLQ